METSNLSCLGVGTTASQTSLEENRLSGLCSSRMLLGSSTSAGSIQSCDVTDILSRSSNVSTGGFLSPITTSSHLDCTLKCSVTVAVPPLGSSFRSIGGSNTEPEIRISTNSKNKQLEELLHFRENDRFNYDDDSDNNTPNIFLNQEDSQENQNEDDCDDDNNNDIDDEDDNEEVGECDSDFDGLDLDDNDHDPVPLGDILDKLQANASLNYSQCSKKENSGNLIQLHAAQEDNDSQTISATVNVAALDLSDPDSIYRHLSELNDTVLRVSAKNSSPPGSGQQSPIPFLDSPDIGNNDSHCQDAMTPNSSTRSSSPANSRTENSELSSMGKISSIIVNGTPSTHSSTQLCLNKNSTFLPSNIQLPTSPLALAVSCSTPSPSVLCSPQPSISRSSSVPCSPNVLTKSSSSPSLATKSTPQSCAICYKVFSNASALAKHRLTHSEERRYHCNICSKAFKRQDHLNGHLLTHRSTKPFACQVDGCGKSYCDARSLRRHKENHHAAGLKQHHQHHTLVSIPTISTSAQMTTPTLAIASKPESTNVESTSPTLTRSTLGDTKIMFSSKGLTAQQLQLIEQLLKESRGGKIVSLPTNPNLSTLQPPPPPPQPISISFPLSQTSSKQTCNISSPEMSPGISTLNLSVKRVASPEKVFHPNGSDKPVECTICNRKFKNIPALNGHMRLHGGYYKKDSDGKKILTSAALRHNFKGTKCNSAFNKHNLKRKCGTSPDESAPLKKISLCPVNLQNSLSNLKPITPASFSGISSSNNNKTNSSIINLTSTIDHKVPFDSQARFPSSVCPIPQPSLAFQSLPPPDTNKLLENLEKKNFALMSIKNEDVHKFSTYDGSLKYSKDKAPMKLKALPAHHSKGIGTKETRTPAVCDGKITQNPVTYTIGFPPISLPTKPIPKLQLEESKSSPNFTQLNSPLVNQALKVKFPSVTEQIQDNKDFSHTLQKPIKTKNTVPTHVSQVKKEQADLIFFPDSEIHSKNLEINEAHFPVISLLPQTEVSAEANDKSAALLNNQQLNSFQSNNFEEFIESNTSLSQFLQSSSCQSVLNQLRASPSTKSHLLLKVDNSSDKSPKIGDCHQAHIPDCTIKSEELLDSKGNHNSARDVQMWSPDDLLDDKILEDYLQAASSCAIFQGSHNEELALELLHKHSGKVISALQDLLTIANKTPEDDAFSNDTEFEDESEDSDMEIDAGTVQSQRTKPSPWTEQEVNSFYEGLVKYKKNFSKISHFVGTKTLKECVEFYYLWKNFCHDEAHSFKNIFYSECSGNTTYSAMYDPAGTETFATKVQEEKPESTSL